MQISTKFTIAIHLLTTVEYFSPREKVTSSLLSSSIGSNPVIIRGLMSDLKKAGLITTRKGTGGITLTRPLSTITFYDVYIAVEKNNEHLFHFHENPSSSCPVGRNIHDALDGSLNALQRSFEDDLKKYTVGDVMSRLNSDIKKEENTHGLV